MSNDISSVIITINDLKKEIHDMKASIQNLTDSVCHVSESNERLVTEVANINKKLNRMDSVLTNTDHKYNDLLSKYEALNEKMIFLDCSARRDNLLFYGVNEESQEGRNPEDCVHKIYDVLERIMDIQNARSFKLVKCHRIGAPTSTMTGTETPSRPRAILCKFDCQQDRQTVWKARGELKDSRYSVQEDFPKEVLDRRKILAPIMFAAKRRKLTAYMVVDKLHIITGEGDNKVTEVYDINSLHKLPQSLDPKYVSTVRKNKTFAFFGQNCPLSNFHPAPFIAQGERYRHVEEYLFVQKAEFAGDDVTKEKIRKAKTPADCKRLGRTINVDKKKWQQQEVAVMTKALYEKFAQNPSLKDYLMATGDFTLAEASPSDRFWGIGAGLGELAASKEKQFKWAGKNKLGQLLMQLRTQFQ
jgi:ribA/ribD-fused uncharacterized protein